jgi:predicted ATPase
MVVKAHRLVTLTGVGGVGKTRLASEVAARIAEDFANGVRVIELATINDPAAVPEAVAAALNIDQQPGISLTDGIAAALEGQSRLLVFDNCEQVLDAVADVIEAILARAADVKILATSRERLLLEDERLCPVAPLDTDAAAALFVDRANAIAAGVSFAGVDEAAAVAQICRRVDGIPLAIELATSRLISMSVTELRDRLNDGFRLLVGSRRMVERHRTLRNAMQWSHDLLSDSEKSLLTQCSAFADGFDLAAASAASGLPDEFVTLDLLDALVRKSLLVVDRSRGRTRFAMLESSASSPKSNWQHRVRPSRLACWSCGTARQRSGSCRPRDSSRLQLGGA